MLEILLGYYICLHNLSTTQKIKEKEELREINHNLIIMVCEELIKGNTTIYFDTIMEDEGTTEDCIELLRKYINQEYKYNDEIINLKLQLIRI